MFHDRCFRSLRLSCFLARKMSDCETIEIASLGRPFQLGMLYDCRRDVLIPGITLWDSETLERNIKVQSQHNSDFKIIASDSSENKINSLNVSASLEASFLCGLVQVKGSAEFLSNKKKSMKVSRVTLQYKTTTKFVQLTMEHLGRGNIKHCNVFDEGSATHVVTALLYGAQAFFVFEQEVSSNESHQEIHGNLHATIKKIPMISIEGEASLNMTETDNQNSSKFSCTFHGDFALENNPASYQDAIKVYTQLPKLLGENGERAVPMTAWLYPLKKLDTAAARLVRDISVSLLRLAQRIMEDLDDADMQCQDLMKVDMAIQFPEIEAKLKKFKGLCSEYKLVFQKQLSRLLPSIRGGGQEEQELVTLLNRKERSPFQSNLISTYLSDREREMNVIRSYLEIMKEVPALSSSKDLDKVVLKSTSDYVVAFAFTSLKEEESYLLDLESYLKKESMNSEAEHVPYNPSSPKKSEQWFCSKDVTADTRQMIQLYLDFKKANCERENLDFCIVSVPDNHVPGSSIHVYEKGTCLSSEYKLPSEPGVPAVLKAEHDCIHLQISPPLHGFSSVESYRVLYQPARCSEWAETTTEGNSAQVAVKKLKPNTEYRFKCKAVCRPGLSLSSSPTEFCKTLPCAPPGLPRPKCLECDKITITWDIPTSVGEDVQVTEYVVEFQEQPETQQEGKLWKSIRTTNRECTLRELKAETAYKIRILANCANAGMSLPSPESLLRTTKLSEKPVTEIPTEARSAQFLEKSYCLSNDNPSVYVLNLAKKFGENASFNQYVFGRKMEEEKNKVLLLLGSTGGGKTTLVNAMVNHILGVKYEERHRFKLIHEVTNRSQAESQTSEVTSYELYDQPGFQVPYSLTIVDTPGFGDTRGMAHDKLITEQVKSFLCSPLGTNHIDAVCFVVQASLARLSAPQKYIFDSILSIFGKDIAENILILVTFADSKNIPVLEAIKAADLPCQKNKKDQPTHFKFNNSVVFAQKKEKSKSGSDSADEEETEDVDGKLNELVWNNNFKQMKKFFEALKVINSKDLTLTKEVLEERERLEKAMAGLTPQITAGLSKMSQIKKFKESLNNESSNMKEFENFEQEVEVLSATRTLSNGFALNCNVCLFTCHSNCSLPEDDCISTCAAINDEGQCVVCPNTCHYSAHSKEKALWTYKTTKEKKTVKEMKENFMKAKGTFMDTKQMLAELESEFQVIEDKLGKLISLSSNCLRRLNEIALKATSLSTIEYLEILIKTEKEERKTGFEDRIIGLEKMKQEFVILDKIARGEKLLEKERDVIRKREKRLQAIALKTKTMKAVEQQWKKAAKLKYGQQK